MLLPARRVYGGSEVAAFVEENKERFTLKLNSDDNYGLEVDVHAGDLLCVPRCWWHQVQGASAGLSAAANFFYAVHDTSLAQPRAAHGTVLGEHLGVVLQSFQE